MCRTTSVRISSTCGATRSLNHHAFQDATARRPVQDLRMQDGPQRFTASLSTGKAERALKGLEGSIMVGWGPTLRRTISTLPTAHILWASAMNKGVVPLLHGIDFGSAPQPFGPVRFRVLKDGGKEHGEVVV